MTESVKVYCTKCKHRTQTALTATGGGESLCRAFLSKPKPIEGAYHYDYPPPSLVPDSCEWHNRNGDCARFEERFGSRLLARLARAIRLSKGKD